MTSLELPPIRRRNGPNKDKNNIEDVLYVFHKCPIGLPTFFVSDLASLPALDVNNVDFAHILGEINANMKVSEQCRIAASQGNQILGMIRRNLTYKEKSLIVPLYKAIVRPHLEYCIQAWSPYLRKDIDMLEKIERRATKLIPGLRDLTYEERLKECRLTTLETRRLRGDQIEVFKILNGYENIDSNLFFSKLKKVK